MMIPPPEHVYTLTKRECDVVVLMKYHQELLRHTFEYLDFYEKHMKFVLYVPIGKQRCVTIGSETSVLRDIGQIGKPRGMDI